MPDYTPKSFKDFADTLFLPGAEHLKRRTITDGRQIKEATRLAHLGRLNNYIIPRWGNCSWTVFEDEEFAEDFLDWLVDLKRVSTHKEGTEAPPPMDMSNSLRNNITETMAISLRLAKRKHYLRVVPEFIRVKRFSKHQNTLTNEDLARLFPLNREDLERIWRLDDGRDHGSGLIFAALSCLGISTGLRSGEARGVEVEKILRLKSGKEIINGLIVDHRLDNDLQLVELKMADAEDDRARVVVIPEQTMQILDMFLETVPDRKGLLFLHRGRPIRKETLGRRWTAALEKAGISTEGRRLTPHSMRYTYNTRMRMLLAENVLQAAIGYKSEDMTILYDRPHLEERLLQLSDQREAFNRFWETPVDQHHFLG